MLIAIKNGENMKIVLKCPVCDEPLNRFDKVFSCPKRHSFDIAKKGYVNLLLANQTHSEASGDSKMMIDARERFLKTDKYSCLKNQIIEIIKEYASKDIVFGDMACGEGYYTNSIHKHFLDHGYDISTYGIDISKAGINACSIKQRALKLDNLLFIIGNLFYLPFLNDSFDVLLNCFAKIEKEEFLRCLKKNGVYIRVLPNKEHLLNMKQILYENVYLNEEKEEEIQGFSLLKKVEVNDEIELNNQEIIDLFMMTPYYYKSSKESAERLCKLNYLKTKISFSILVYRKE